MTQYQKAMHIARSAAQCHMQPEVLIDFLIDCGLEKYQRKAIALWLKLTPDE